MIEICRRIFKSFNVSNLSVCIVWCTDQATLRSARCNGKGKMFVFISFEHLPEIFLIVRRIERDTVIKLHWSSCNVPVILVRF